LISSPSGTKNKIVVFGEWGPFTYGAPSKILQVPEEEKSGQSLVTPSQIADYSLQPSMTRSKPFTAQPPQHQLVEKQLRRSEVPPSESSQTNLMVRNKSNFQSHLTQRLAPDDCRRALARWVSKQRCVNKKVPQECHITGIVSYQTIEVTLDFILLVL
jgi:hypothetical protein